jgi:hypothetical protein
VSQAPLECVPQDSPVAQRMADLDRAVREAIASIDTEIDGDKMLAIWDTIAAIAARVREWKAQAEATFIATLIDHGNDQYPAEFVVGDVRYYVGTDKRTKPRDKVRVLEAILDKTAGDMKLAVEMLASDAFKPGAVRDLLGDESFDTLFETTTVDDLKTGKPRRGIHSVNTKFLNQ